MFWSLFEAGTSIGKKGSEDGVILQDEEHCLGARITLERGGYAPFSITCGIYGCMAHTAFASSDAEAAIKYEGMKQGLADLLAESNETKFIAALEAFVEQF